MNESVLLRKSLFRLLVKALLLGRIHLLLKDGPNQPGCVSIVMNLIWIFLGWWEIAVIHLVCGLLLCITIVGIPFGLQHFKMALSSIFPFGKGIR